MILPLGRRGTLEKDQTVEGRSGSDMFEAHVLQIEMSSRQKEVQIWCLGEKKGLEIITGAMGVTGSP